LGGSFRKKNGMINEMMRVLIMHQRSRRHKAKLIIPFTVEKEYHLKLTKTAGLRITILERKIE